MQTLAVTESIGLVSTVLEAAILVLLPLELFRVWRRRQLDWPRVREMLASVSPFLVQLLFGASIVAAILALYAGAASLVSWRIPTTAWSVLLCVLAVDFMYYWDHRLSHQVRALWALYHSVHHSSPQFDQTTALRVSVVDGLFSPWFYVPVVLVGFHPLLVVSCFGFILAYQTWLHTETIGRLGWFDAVFNSPSNHRVHHGSQPGYLDRNYGAVLMIWDRLFGTYRAETETPVYGLTQPIATSNPIEVHLCEARRLWRDLRNAPSRGDRWRLLWRRPGWRPAASS